MVMVQVNPIQRIQIMPQPVTMEEAEVEQQFYEDPTRPLEHPKKMSSL